MRIIKVISWSYIIVGGLLCLASAYVPAIIMVGIGLIARDIKVND